MRVNHTRKRLEKRIQEKLALIFLKGELKNPLLNSMTIHHVILSENFKRASVYFSLYEPKVNIREARLLLKKSEGFLRSRLSEHLRLKQMPYLTFQIDQQFLDHERVESLLSEAFDDNGHD